MRLIGLLLFFFISLFCSAQLNVIDVTKGPLPKSIKYSGHVKQAIRWMDSTGDNLVVITETGETQSKNGDDDFRDAALYAYHFLIVGDSSKLTWRVYDFVRECPVDIELYFVDKTFSVTDLNKDGNAEVWLMYKSYCHGDVSPVPMKIIMYENNKKFAARGDTKVKVSDTEYMGGTFSFDAAFKNAPAVFQTYAEKLWQQHKEETWRK